MEATPVHKERSFLIIISIAVILGFCFIYTENFRVAFLPNFGSASSNVNYQVSDISISPNPSFEGSPVTVTAIINKSGYETDSPNKGTWVRFYVKGVPVGTEVEIPEMASYSQKAISFLYDPSTPGDYAFKACADSREQIFETNERDNCRNATLSVAEKDPVYSVENISWSPQSPQPGDTITVTAVIKRVGGVTESGPYVNLSLGNYKTSKQAPLININSGDTGEAIVAFSPISYLGIPDLKVCVLNLNSPFCETATIE